MSQKKTDLGGKAGHQLIVNVDESEEPVKKSHFITFWFVLMNITHLDIFESYIYNIYLLSVDLTDNLD